MPFDTYKFTEGRATALRDNDRFLRGIRKKKEGAERLLPAERSPWTQSLRVEYHKEGLDTWTNQRVYLVCRMFRCTLHELCAWAGLFDDEAIAAFQKNKYWPMFLTLQWNKLVRFKLKWKGAEIQDAMAAKGFYWGDLPKNEEEKAA